MIESMIYDVGYYFVARSADSLTACNMIKKTGYLNEANKNTREATLNDKLGKHMLSSIFKDGILRPLIIGGVLFGMDNLLGVESNIFNLHHSYLYSEGTLGYLAASANLVNTYVKDNLKRNNLVALLGILPALHGHYIESPVRNVMRKSFVKIKESLTSRSD